MADEKPKLTVKIINPDEILFEGTADYILAPGKETMLGLLPGHTPMFAELGKGELQVHSEKEENMAIESGILRIKNDIVTILVGAAPKIVDKPSA
ncbi:MAG: hypothetical protein WCO52_00755 [bacterium]